MATANVYCLIPAPISRVFERLADHENYDQLASVSCSKLLQEGPAERNGLGAVRELSVSIIRFVEDITAYQAPNLMEYRVRECYLCFGKNGLKKNGFKKHKWQVRFPLIHQLGRITLLETSEGTEIQWLSQFSVNLPFGRQLARLLRPFVERNFARILQDIRMLLAQSNLP